MQHANLDGFRRRGRAREHGQRGANEEFVEFGFHERFQFQVY
jgi:hypothetical protein